MFRFSLVIPNSLIIGRPTKREDDPVIANTIKIRISSQRYVTFHFFSNFVKRNSINFKRIKNATSARAIFRTIWYSAINKLVNLKLEYNRIRAPKIGKISCQFLTISQRALKCSIIFNTAANIINLWELYRLIGFVYMCFESK